MPWLPDPIMGGDGHYKPYEALTPEDRQTSNHSRPGLQPFRTLSKEGYKNYFMCEEQVRIHQGSGLWSLDNETLLDQMFSGNQQSSAKSVRYLCCIFQEKQRQDTVGLLCAQSARALVTCCECDKPRIIYSRSRLSQRDQFTLSLLLSEDKYTCGSQLIPQGHHMYRVQARLALTCGDTVEVPYYSCDLGRADICCHCAASGAERDPILRQQFKTVLPVCNDCLEKGKTCPVARLLQKK